MRKANKNPPTEPTTTLTFFDYEYHRMKFNEPGPSGLLGGYQRLENRIVTTTDKATLQCVLTDELLARLIRYCKRYRGGGPNGRLRDACIPALRRIGIDLAWS
jgi:hypothetical protein